MAPSQPMHESMTLSRALVSNSMRAYIPSESTLSSPPPERYWVQPVTKPTSLSTKCLVSALSAPRSYCELASEKTIMFPRVSGTVLFKQGFSDSPFIVFENHPLG